MKTSLAMLLGELILISCPSAIADDLVNVQGRSLEKVHWFHGRTQLGIEDNSPIITDWRTAPNKTTFKVVIPPAPKPINEEVVIQAGQSDGSSSVSTSRSLTPSRFRSNILPSNGNLPNGNTVASHPPVGTLLRGANPPVKKNLQ
jgi:hypothetical protein